MGGGREEGEEGKEGRGRRVSRVARLGRCEAAPHDEEVVLNVLGLGV